MVMLLPVPLLDAFCDDPRGPLVLGLVQAHMSQYDTETLCTVLLSQRTLWELTGDYYNKDDIRQSYVRVIGSIILRRIKKAGL